jgi:fibronectin type 3 domain-containing protein
MNPSCLKRSVSLLLSFVLLLSFLPLLNKAGAAAFYGDNERFDDFQNLAPGIPVGNHTVEPPVQGQSITSSNTNAATLNGWRSNASAGVWSIGSDDGSNVGMYYNGAGTSSAWIVGYSANDVLMSASVKLHPNTPASMPSSPSYFGLAARVLDNANMYALAIRKLSASQYNLVLFKRVAGTITEVSQSVPISDFTPGQYYRLTFQITGTQGNIALTGSIEGGPTVTALLTESSLPSPGSSVGFFGNPNMRMYVDDVYVMKLYPNAPTGVAVVSEVDNQVSLKWSGAAGAERYYIKRGTAPDGPFTTIGTVDSGSYQDTAAVNGSTYYYAVSSAAKAQNGTYLDGSLSVPAAATPRASAAVPAAPDRLSGSIRDSEIGLAWTGASDAVGYLVKRSGSHGGPYYVAAAVYGATTSYLDQGLTVGSDYYYVVSAFNASGESTPSSEFYGRTAYPPNAPQGLTAVPGNSAIKLHWQGVTDAVYYTVKRAGSSGGSYSTIGSDLTGTEYVDGTPENGLTYFYVVQARNANNSSSHDSNEASAMPKKRYTFTETQVTASGYDRIYNGDLNWGNKAVNTIDDNLNTRWGVNGIGEWIQYDLGAMSTVGYAGIAFYKGNERSYFFEVQASADGMAWNTLYSGASSGSTLQIENFDIPDTDARYIRIAGKGNSATGYNGYTVVHIYSPSTGVMDNDPIPPAEPVPAPGYAPRPAKAGLYNPDGTPHIMPEPNQTTGQRINVLDYGAVGDGIADDRPAIQSAVDAAQPGDEVYLPNGIYKLLSATTSDTHIRLKSGVNFLGESREGAILLSDFDNRLGPDQVSTGLTNPSSRVLSAMSLNNIVISDLTITSTWNSEYPTSPEISHPLRGGYKHGIYIDRSSSQPAPYNIIVDNVIMERFEKTGVRMAKGQHLVVRNSLFRDVTDIGGGGAGYGIALQGDFKNNRFGFEEDSQYNLIEHNVFDGTNALRHGIIVQAYSHNNAVRHNTLINNTYDAIDLHGEDEYLNEVHDNLVTGTRRGAGIALGNTGGGFPSNHSEAGPYNYIHNNILRNNAGGITVVLGSPDTVIENNIIEIDPDTFVRGPYQQELTGLRLLNAPRTVARNNTIRNFEASDIPVLLDYDPGDTNANNIGDGNPRDVQLTDNIIANSVKGIEIRRGHGHVVSQSEAQLINISGSSVYEAVYYAVEDAQAGGNGPFAALYKFNLSDIEPLREAALQLSGRLTDVNPGGETITLSVYGMPDGDIGSPSAAAASGGVYLGEFTMRGFKDNSYNLPYNVDSYNVSSAALSNYLNQRLGGNAVFLVADTKGQGVPIELYSASNPYLTVRPVLKTAKAARVIEEPGEEEPGEEEPGEEEPGKEEPGEVEPGEEEPGEEEPGEEEPGKEEPGEEEPGKEEPGKEEPGEDEPGKEEPGKEEPGEDEPGKEEPGKEEPGEDEPGGESPGEGSAPPAASNHTPGALGVSLSPTIVTANGKRVAEAKADGKAIEDAVKAAKDGRIILSVGSQDNVMEVRVSVDGGSLRKAAGDGRVQTVSVEIGLGSYQLPVDEALLQLISDSSKILVVIARDDAAAIQAQADGLNPQASAEFAVSVVKPDGTTTWITSFRQYVSRTILTEKAVNSGTLAAVHVEKNGDGTVRYAPVPFTVDGREVKIYSRTNSTYLILENQVSFEDGANHWAKEAIGLMANRRIALGASDREFLPDQAVTRAEFAALVTRSLGLAGDASAASSKVAGFSDLSEKEWYFSAVKAAADAGIVSGYEDGAFQPYRKITRQEMAVMIHRAMMFAGYKQDGVQGDAVPFEDEGELQAWSKEAVSVMASMQIVNGVGQDRFAPDETATRAQSSAILYRMLQQLTFTN